MKFRVIMKTPDALEYALMTAYPVEESASQEAIEVASKGIEDAMELCERKWFRCGELLTVEIDTEAQTCVVVPVRE